MLLQGISLALSWFSYDSSPFTIIELEADSGIFDFFNTIAG
jgi:hypothetical protein